MKRITASRPSPATVISCIALFVALGGVSYGVATNSIDSREIANGTIRSKDIRNNNVLGSDLRNNDVRAIDIRNNTIRGRDIAADTITDDQIDESKLTQVPSALTADQLGGVAAGEYARVRQEPVRVVGAAGQPPFESGYGAAGGGALAPGFWKDAFGVVRLQGTVSGGAGGAVFTLPTGYRPVATARFAVAGTGAASDVAEVRPDGVVTITAGEASLDGVVFRAATP